MPTLECPTCGKRVTYATREEVPFRPFCCKRCKLIDLGKWLNEEYRITEELAEPIEPSSDKRGAPEDDLDRAG
ncbi:MAG: DNA gyrase inhibitor YacG [Phycisphaerae bacterium]|nr:DNA gyrase inhibitor YacG [Phycisphaerae bacterium]